jgi:uncharacterized membrane protein
VPRSQESYLGVDISEIVSQVERRERDETFQNFLTTRYASLTATILVSFILSTSCYSRSTSVSYSLKQIREEYPAVYYFMNLNMMLYGVKIFYNIFAILRSTHENLKQIKRIGIFLFLCGQVLTIQGMICLWNQRMSDLL